MNPAGDELSRVLIYVQQVQDELSAGLAVADEGTRLEALRALRSLWTGLQNACERHIAGVKLLEAQERYRAALAGFLELARVYEGWPEQRETMTSLEALTASMHGLDGARRVQTQAHERQRLDALAADEELPPDVRDAQEMTEAHDAAW